MMEKIAEETEKLDKQGKDKKKKKHKDKHHKKHKKKDKHKNKRESQSAGDSSEGKISANESSVVRETSSPKKNKKKY
jgi:hypothetical protein